MTIDTKTLVGVALPALPDGYDAATIADRYQSAIDGEPQDIGAWQGMHIPYRLMSPNYADGPGGVKTDIVNPAHLLGNAEEMAVYQYGIFAWEETTPVDRLWDGHGINLNVPDALMPAALKTCKAMGIRHARLTCSWSDFLFVSPDTLKPDVAARLKYQVTECKKAGIRPLFNFDTNTIAPCPMQDGAVTLLKPLTPGDTTALVKPNNGGVPVPYKSGFAYVTVYAGIQVLWTDCKPEGDGWRVSFGIPWPDFAGKEWAAGPHDAGDVLPSAYLACRPFSDDGTALSEESYRVFQQSLGGLIDFLNTCGLRKSKASTDPGFDIEVCNELTSWGFTDLSRYVGAPCPPASLDRIYGESVATVRAQPENDGIRYINGFENQGAGGSASSTKPGTSSNSMHPYMSAYRLRDVTPTVADAFTRTRYDGFVPDIEIIAPETQMSWRKQENFATALCPFSVAWWGTVKGRGIQPRTNPADLSSPVALEPSGKPAREVYQDLTEWGNHPGYAANGGPLPTAEIDRLNAKWWLRSFLLFISKGGGRLYQYAAMGEGFGILSQANDSLPNTEPKPVTLFKRLKSLLTGKAITKPREIRLVSISETHGQAQFRGNGTPDYPDLPNRDVLVAPAFQLADDTFAVAVWIMTGDYRSDLPEAKYTLRWEGVNVGKDSTFAYRDLEKIAAKIIKPTATGNGWVEFDLMVTDTPRYLMMRKV